MDTADRRLLLQRAEKVLSSRRSLFSSINIPEEIQRKLKPTVLVIYLFIYFFSKLRFLEYPHVTDGCLLCSFWNIPVTFEANDGLLSSQAPSLQFVGSSLLASFLISLQRTFQLPFIIPRNPLYGECFHYYLHQTFQKYSVPLDLNSLISS